MVDPNESLSRFINNPKHCRDGKPRPRVFEPTAKSKTGALSWALLGRQSGEVCLSTSRTSGLTSSEIWEIGKRVLRRAHPSNVYARADVRARVFEEHGLAVRGDRRPRYHASILNWPEPEEERKSIAQQLAAAAGSIIRNDEGQRNPRMT